jgi:hypothetical protein
LEYVGSHTLHFVGHLISIFFLKGLASGAMELDYTIGFVGCALFVLGFIYDIHTENVEYPRWRIL